MARLCQGEREQNGRHNTIEDIIIVRGGGKETRRLSRVRWHLRPALLTKRVLARIAHIKEVVLVPETRSGCQCRKMRSKLLRMGRLLVLLVDRAHQSRGWRKGFIHEDEDGLLRCELDALANHVNELTDR